VVDYKVGHALLLSAHQLQIDDLLQHSWQVKQMEIEKGHI
jgi:aspartokinase-like uncharacterized kinase